MSALEARDLGLRFGGVQALDGVDLQVEPGELLAVVGPNGAGKTSLLNVCSRLVDPTTGTLTFAGDDLLARSPHAAAAAGIARTFQNLELIEAASLLENLLVGCDLHRRTRWWQELLLTPFARRQEGEFREQAETWIEALELARHRDEPAGALPYGVRKRIELARALCTRPRLLLLDEPSSGLTAEERDDLRFALLDLRRSRSLTMLLVEHDLPLVHALADRVLVLAEGRVLALGTPEEVRGDERVLEAFAGGL